MAVNRIFYSELDEAITEVLNSIIETDEFKRRFKKLIENAFIENCSNQDLLGVLELIDVGEEGTEE